MGAEIDIGGGGDGKFVSQGSQVLALLPQTQDDVGTIEQAPLTLWSPNLGVLNNGSQGLVEYQESGDSSGFLNISNNQSQKQGLLGQQIQTETGLYPISALFPVDVSKLPAQKLIQEQEILLGTTSVTGMKHLPDFQCLEMPNTSFVNKVFEQAMQSFKANYNDLGGWQDAVKLGIKYAATEMVRLVESRAMPVNNRVFGFGLGDWEELRKVTGVGIVP